MAPTSPLDFKNKDLQLSRILFSSLNWLSIRTFSPWTKDLLNLRFIDNTGIPSIIEQGYELLTNDGRLVLVGVPRKHNNINIFTLPLHFGKQIIGSHGGESQPHVDIPRYLKLFKNNMAEFKLLISKRYYLEDINQAIIDMKEGKSAGRILIEMSWTQR